MVKKRDISRSITLEWGSDTSAQNPMLNTDNSYNHLTKDGHKHKKEKTLSHGEEEHIILLRGKQNQAPQKDLELGLKSITHKRIAEKIATLAAGKGLGVKLKDEDKPYDDLSPEQRKNVDAVYEILDKGLTDNYKVAMNGIVYFNLASFIVTQVKPDFIKEKKKVLPQPIYISAIPNERLRFSRGKMNDQAKYYIPYHYYHEDWCYDGKQRRTPKMPSIIPIEKYIKLSEQGGDEIKEAFIVCSNEHPDAGKKRYLSFAISGDKGIFDGSYPVPKWKANSSINDIQNEFEASCIRTDFIMNGLHIFAVVNIYSQKFNDLTDITNDEGDINEEWAEELDVVRKLKGSHNSGRVIVNPLGTDDPKMDGKIEVETISIDFPADMYKSISQESTTGILTAWGVSPDLFGVTKPESSGLRSQEGFMKVGILMLKEMVSGYQDTLSNGINEILSYYGHDDVEVFVEPQDNDIYLSIMSEIAQDYMDVNEFRKRVLGLEEMTKEDIESMAELRSKLKASKTKSDG